MSAKVEISLAARSDLKEVLIYSSANFGENVADAYAADLNAAIARIGKNPNVGRAYDARHGVLFQYNCRRHAIFYSRTTELVTIVRVLHLSMDFMRHLPR